MPVNGREPQLSWLADAPVFIDEGNYAAAVKLGSPRQEHGARRDADEREHPRAALISSSPGTPVP